MRGIECRAVTPEEISRELEGIVKNQQENKYAFQVGLCDLDFDIDEDNLYALGITLPFQRIDQAEQALRVRVIVPTQFIEYDDTEHQVLVFDPRPVGYSGFMDCVTHSLALTDLGLFEVGRYPALNMSAQNRSWQWFLHRRLATADEINNLQVDRGLTSSEVVKHIHSALTGV